jgi:hypothetical protein
MTMTTNVKITTDYIHPGKKLSVKSVNPVDGTLYRQLTVDQTKLDEHGGKYECETMYVHDGSKLIVEEIE